LALTALGLLSAFTIAAVSKFGTADTDFEMNEDLRVVQANVPEGVAIGVCDSGRLELEKHSRYILYLSRHHSLLVRPVSDQDFVFCMGSVEAFDGYQKLNLQLHLYSVFRKIE